MDIFFSSDFIRLDDALKKGGLVSTGGHAKIVIQNGEVLLNDGICTMRGKKLYGGETVKFDHQVLRIIKKWMS